MQTASKISDNSKKLLKELPQLSADELEYWVNYHNDAYFIKNAPEISDEVFDKLVETLRMVKPDAEVLSQIGSDIQLPRKSEGAVRHASPMLSLDKCYDDQTFSKWEEKISGEIRDFLTAGTDLEEIAGPEEKALISDGQRMIRISMPKITSTQP